MFSESGVDMLFFWSQRPPQVDIAPRRLVYLLGLVGLLLLTGACAAGLHPYPPGPIDQKPAILLCNQNADCLDGQFCFRRYCRTKNLPKGQYVSLHLLMPENHNYLDKNMVVTNQQFIGIDASRFVSKQDGTSLSILVREAHQVTVGLKHEKGAITKSKEGIRVRIRFYDSDTIPGNPLKTEVETGFYNQALARLTDGSYEVEIKVLDGKHPPHRIPKQNVTESGKLLFEIPPDDDYPRLKGKIVAAGKDGKPIKDLTLQVFSAEGKIISGTCTTNENGAFSMWLSAKEKPHAIRIRMRNTANPHPQIDIPFSPALLTKGQHIDLGTLAIGHIDQLVRVHGTVNVLRNQALPQAHVHLIGKIQLKGQFEGKPLMGHYRIDTSADANGNFEAFVFPGDYVVDVLPPVESTNQWARASLHIPDLNASKKLEVSLQQKPSITGKVCEKGQAGDCSKTISQTQIKAVWRQPLNMTITRDALDIVPPTSNETKLSQDNGWYTLPLDPGVYDLLFIPPDGSQLARRILYNVRVEAKTKGEPIHAFLDPAKHLVSTVVGPDNFPIPNVIVEMYNYTTDPKQPTYLLGRATTNSQGKFSLAYHIPQASTD